MSAFRRLFLGCVLGCALGAWEASDASAQAAEPAPAPETPATPPAAPPVAAPTAPVAPIAPATGTAPAAQPVPALPAQPAPQPSTPATTAAPAQPAAPGAAPTAVPAAQDQKQDDKDEEPTPPPSETAEPAATTVPTSAGAGTSITADAEIALEETPAEALEDEKDELSWSASIHWGQSYSATGISRGSQQSYNPQYSWDFTASLGYWLDELTSLSLRQPLSIELTDSDTTATRQELWLLDTTLDATRKFWKNEPAPGDSLSLSGGLGLVFPVSPSSQAAHLILGTRAKVGFEYGKKKVLRGLSVGTGVAYLRRWASSNQVHADAPYACITATDDIAYSCTQLGGTSTTRDVIRADVHGELRPIEKLAVNASFSLGWNRGHGLDDSDYVLPSTGYAVNLPDDETHWRNTRELVLGVSYDFTDWFSVSANATNSFRELGPDAKYRGPFEDVDMAFGLNLSLSIDQLYLAQRGRGAAGD